MTRPPRWRWIGVLLAVALPIWGATLGAGVEAGHPTLVTFVACAVLAITFGHVGLAVAEWQVVPIFWLRDLGVAILMGGTAWAVGRWAGGGPVDPALIGALGAYFLMVWPSEVRRRWS